MRFVAVPNSLFNYIVEKKDNKKVVIRKHPLSPSALKTYVYLLSCVFEKNKVKVKYRTISDRCGFGDVKTAHRAVKTLENLGLVGKKNRAGNKKMKIANEYTVARLSGGFFMLDTKVFKTDMDSTAFSVYLSLLKNANHYAAEALAWPSTNKISAETGITKVSVRRKIEYLVEHLFIKRIRKINGAGDNGNNNYYIIPIEKRESICKKSRFIKMRTRLLIVAMLANLKDERHISFCIDIRKPLFQCRAGIQRYEGYYHSLYHIRAKRALSGHTDDQNLHKQGSFLSLFGGLKMPYLFLYPLGYVTMQKEKVYLFKLAEDFKRGVYLIPPPWQLPVAVKVEYTGENVYGS